MFLVLSLAAVAAAAVVIYSRWSSAQPQMAAESSRRAHQFAQVSLVLARCVEGVAAAMDLSRSQGPREPRVLDPYDQEDPNDWDR